MSREVRVIAGIETEHPIFCPTSGQIGKEQLRRRNIDLAKAFVGDFPADGNVEWSYRYPFELYTFPGTINRVLPNGGRLYDEICFVETCTPECSDPAAVVLAEAEQLQLLEFYVAAHAEQRDAEKFLLTKLNVEYGDDLPFSSSNACHENYSVSPQLFRSLTTPSHLSLGAWIPFLITRTVFTGSGCAFARLPYELRERKKKSDDQRLQGARHLAKEFPSEAVECQLSQRADFFSTLYELETMKFRPIVNLRDEPHADPTKARRLHVITGDTNRCELATYLKVGVSQIVLMMLEADSITDDFQLADPLAALRIVSRDWSLREPIQMCRGGWETAVGLQWRLLQQARVFHRVYQRTLPRYVRTVLDLWETTLSALVRGDLAFLDGRLDWVSKYHLAQQYQARDPAVGRGQAFAAVDSWYSVIGDPTFDAFRRERMVKLVDSIGAEFASGFQPTRAALRRWMLRHLAVARLTWDWVELKTGETFFLPDPGRPVAIDERGSEIDFISRLSCD